jgi:predicted O-methyltransferase YrrM
MDFLRFLLSMIKTNNQVDPSDTSMIDVNQEAKNLLQTTLQCEDVKKLSEIIKETKQNLEGNCLFFNASFRPRNIPSLVYNIAEFSKRASRIMEIGFNAGHSALIMLQSSPSSTITYFDIGDHKYTRKTFDYLNAKYPKRLSIHYGNSNVTIPQLQSSLEPFDLILIDGGHSQECARQDIYNCRQLSKPSTIVLFDDADMFGLSRLLKQVISLGIIELIPLPLPCNKQVAFRYSAKE